MKLTIAPKRWSRVDLPNRLYYLESCRNNLLRVAPFWVEEEAHLRGHLPGTEEGAESWLLGPIPVVRTLRYLINGVRSGGRPRVPSRRLRVDGRSVTRVFPYGFHEGLLFYDTEAHVWSIGEQHQGQKYRRARDSQPGAALVLGTSSLSCIPVVDILNKLFCEHRAVVCKIPPRFARLQPVFEALFHPLVRDRHVQLIFGDEEVGRELLDLPIFDTIHLTGRPKTYQEILGKNRYTQRSFTAELGCATPAVILPGTWSESELRFQVRHLVSALTLYGGYTCFAPQVLILGKHWAYRASFLKALKSELSKAEKRDDIYAGIPDRRYRFRQEHPQAEHFGPRSVVHLGPDDESSLFSEEAYCGMLAVVELEDDNIPDFLNRAVRFCNQRLWGDLSCLLVVDPVTRQHHEREIAHGIAELEYGTVGINAFTGLAFASCVTPWGSYLDASQDTGNGWVHNTFFFDRPEKTVMEGPFVPKMPWPWVKPFPKLRKFGQALFELEAHPTPLTAGRFIKQFGASLWKNRRQQR